jgi:hypothetical protein
MTRFARFAAPAVPAGALVVYRIGTFIPVPGIDRRGGALLQRPVEHDPRHRQHVTITTGTMFLMWLGEQITERGIGNGISMIILGASWRACRARSAAPRARSAPARCSRVRDRC